MNIIIIGCGKVGRILTHELSKEGHDVTVIDTNPDMIRKVTIQTDCMGIIGNGTSYITLEEADVRNADLLVAITQSDEVNLLCCFVAKDAGCKTVARVRNPIYLTEKEKFKKELGISMIINPERSAAWRVKQLLSFPSAIEVSSFANNRIDLVAVRVKSGMPIIGQKIRDIQQIHKKPVLICIVERGEQVIIPNGDVEILEDDIISFISAANDTLKVFNAMGIHEGAIKNVMIIGGGQTGFCIGDMLLQTGMEVRIIEKSIKRCEELSDIMPNAEIICGDGSDYELLQEEGLDHFDACVTATNMDEQNIILSLYAKDKIKKKVITKLSHIDYGQIVKELNIENVVDPKETAKEYIVQYVRALQNSQGSNVETLYKLRNDRAEALQFTNIEKSSLVGIPFKDMKFKENVLIGGLIRSGRLIIPGGADSIQVGDSVIVVTTHKGFHDLEDVLER